MRHLYHYCGSPPHSRSSQSGFGLLQAMLLVMIVGAVVAAAAVLIQSKRPAQQATNQQEYLRWADEALAAYAAANSRLPCPSSEWSDNPALVMSDCHDPDAGHAVGYLPIALLPGAPELGAGAGPIRYSVATGVLVPSLAAGASQPALSLPGDSYTPLNEQGEPFEDEDSKPALASFVANGHDFCAALHLNSHPEAATDPSYASALDRANRPFNIAYGLLAAGTTPGADDRFDTALSLQLPNQSTTNEIGQDDRVRVRTFDSLAHAAGCRQYMVTDAHDAFSEVTSISLLSMNAIAGAVSNHSTVVSFQETNEGNGEAQVRDATFAQVMAIAGVTLSVLTAIDTIQSLGFHYVKLTGDVAICIASLGLVCAPVALDIVSIVMSTVASVSSIASIALNAGAMIPVGLALDANTKARDRAVSSRPSPETRSVDDVLKSMHATLYGVEKDVCKLRIDSKTKLPIPKKDGDGNPVMEDDVPQFECDEVTEFVAGLDQQIVDAEKKAASVKATERLYFNNRIRYFEDSNISYRMDLAASNRKYKGTRCVSRPGGGMQSSGGRCVAGVLGEANDWAEEDYFLPSALIDAKAKRSLAQEWSMAEVSANEAKELVKQKTTSLDQFEDLVSVAQGGADKDCRNVVDKNTQQICDNSRSEVLYMQTCTYKSISSDGAVIVIDESRPGPGKEIDYNLQCKPILELDLTRTKKALTDKERARDAVYARYLNQTTPHLNYPDSWDRQMVVIDEDAGTYTWNSENRRRYGWVPDHSTGWGSSAVGNGAHLIYPTKKYNDWDCFWGDLGSECTHYPYSRAYMDWRSIVQEEKDAAELVVTNKQLFADLKAQYDELKAAAAAGTAVAETLAFGANGVMVKADSRGASGPGKKLDTTP